MCNSNAGPSIRDKTLPHSDPSVGNIHSDDWWTSQNNRPTGYAAPTGIQPGAPMISHPQAQGYGNPSPGLGGANIWGNWNQSAGNQPIVRADGRPGPRDPGQYANLTPTAPPTPTAPAAPAAPTRASVLASGNVPQVTLTAQKGADVTRNALARELRKNGELKRNTFSGGLA